MILEGDHPQVAMVNLCQTMRVAQVRWRLTHQRALAAVHVLGQEKRRCGDRFVSRHHFFKHSRGFLWFMMCNLLISGSTGGAEAQLLINVQNQVRAGESLEKEAAKQPEEKRKENEEEGVLPMEWVPIDVQNPGVDYEELLMQSAANEPEVVAADQN